MSSIVLVSKDAQVFSEFAPALQQRDGVTFTQVSSGEQLLAMAGKTKVDAVVLGEELADSSGLKFSETLMKKHPLVNCAIVSTLPPDQFHEETEGLGIFMQLPPQPKAEDASKMFELLESIHALMG